MLRVAWTTRFRTRTNDIGCAQIIWAFGFRVAASVRTWERLNDNGHKPTRHYLLLFYVFRCISQRMTKAALYVRISNYTVRTASSVCIYTVWRQKGMGKETFTGCRSRSRAPRPLFHTRAHTHNGAQTSWSIFISITLKFDRFEYIICSVKNFRFVPLLFVSPHFIFFTPDAAATATPSIVWVCVRRYSICSYATRFAHSLHIPQ